ncbi:MAG: Na/Pi cotransporter family protein [Firmicutes bacterium]|nr:Na/Pi cotransporter family protein [Bacillota bacterium]
MVFKTAGRFILALILLLGGIGSVSKNLREITGGLLYKLLRIYTSTPLKGFLLGVASTVFLQSSSLVTVMVVGFINGGFLTLLQGLSVVIGANLGTTLTSQFFSMETSWLIRPIVIAGLITYTGELIFKRNLGGRLFLAIALVLSGMELLVITLEPLSKTVFFRNLYLFSKGTPWKGILVGAVSSAIIQSSSVTIGSVILLSKEKILELPEALAMILGADLGTCITAMLASLGTILPAKRVAWGHLIFNTITILVVLPFWRHFLWLITATSPYFSQQVANAHMLYNVLGVIVFLPFVDKFASMLEYIIKGKNH